MRKFITVLSALALVASLTACTDEKSDEYNQEVADSTASMLEEYYQGMRTADFDMTFKNYPEFYVNNIQLELEYYEGTEDEYLSADNATWYDETYGEDATISVDVVSTTLMTDAVTKKYNDLVTNFYMETATVQNVYTVVVDKTVSGSISTDTVQATWTVLEIDDCYWLYDTYFEDLADSLANTESEEDVTFTIVVT
jgi:hypothetical protein